MHDEQTPPPPHLPFHTPLHNPHHHTKHPEHTHTSPYHRQKPTTTTQQTQTDRHRQRYKVQNPYDENDRKPPNNKEEEHKDRERHWKWKREREKQTDRHTDKQKKDRKQDKTDRTEPNAIHMSPTQDLKHHGLPPNCVKHCLTDMVPGFETFKCDLADDSFAGYKHDGLDRLRGCKPSGEWANRSTLFPVAALVQRQDRLFCDIPSEQRKDVRGRSGLASRPGL